MTVINLDGNTKTHFNFDRSEELQIFEKVWLSRVHLGEAGVFLASLRPVFGETMPGAISEAISGKAPNEHWANWSGSGEIATAVRLDAAVEAPRLYTFLPMGEQAEAPFPKHLHGSFFPSPNRKNLNVHDKLNAVLLDKATSLVADAIREVVTDPSGPQTKWLAEGERAAIVSDLHSWEQVGSLTTDDDLVCKRMQWSPGKKDNQR